LKLTERRLDVRFQREARVLAWLNHPHIAAVYGLEESGGVRAIAMELVEGPTLAERVARAGFPHGFDQWISAAGTSWATMALPLASPARTAMASSGRIGVQPIAATYNGSQTLLGTLITIQH
jgi:serine/threonine protein kinase